MARLIVDCQSYGEVDRGLDQALDAQHWRQQRRVRPSAHTLEMWPQRPWPARLSFGILPYRYV